MRDVGLLVSVIVLVVLPAVFVQPRPPSAVPQGLLDTAGGALAIGLAVGRLTAVALDNPGGLTSLNDLLIIRSGVEFWSGLAAGIGWLWFRATRENVRPMVRLAALAPAGLAAWASYEATCIARDGCPGPISSIGLRPDGLAQRMFPVGLAVAVAAVAAALLIGRAQRRGVAASQIVVGTVLAVATVRSIASIWLPRIGNGLTRQHEASIAILVVSLATLATLRTRSQRTTVEQAS